MARASSESVDNNNNIIKVVLNINELNRENIIIFNNNKPVYIYNKLYIYQP